ncbi:MAG TPA: hypothetical protein VJ020_13640 [Anaerolineales bacterium]|nr:hypothetical protein [Anaerolineales bacterium]
MKMFTPLLLVVIATLILAACAPTDPIIESEATQPGGAVTDSTSEPITSTEVPSDPTARPILDVQSVTAEVLIPTIIPSLAVETHITPNPSAQPPAGTEKWIELAKQDLAKRLSIDLSQITFIEYRNVTWPDGSLGCPQPDMGYIQIMIDGYAIWLGAGKQVYEYHGSGDRDPFLCERSDEFVPPGLESLIVEAKQDLAQRLSISVTRISLVKAEVVVWPDSSLGCPQPGMLYKQVPEDGALVILLVEGNVYEYHIGGSRGLFLCEKVYKDPNPPPQLDLYNLTPQRTTPPPAPDNSIPPGADK